MNDLAFNIWFTLLMQHITADQKTYPVVEYLIKTDKEASKLFCSLFALELPPGEVFRFMMRCYPETIAEIKGICAKTITA